MNTIASNMLDTFAAHDRRLNTIDRRVTKIETTMTIMTPHLATKADVKEAMNTQLRWMIGLFFGSFVGLGALIYSTQSGLEAHLDRRFDHVDHRIDQVDRRLDQMDRRLNQVDQRLERVEHRLERVENRLERVEQVVFVPSVPVSPTP